MTMPSDPVRIVDSITLPVSGTISATLSGPISVQSTPWLFDIARGSLSGYTAWEKMGYTSGGTTTETDVWAGAAAYVFPTAAMQMECISSSANDNAAGTGAKTVRIWYLKNDHTEATTDVTLTGTTAVPTSVSDIFRIQAFRIVNFGAATTTYRAIGAIDVRHLTDTPVYSRILAGQTRARNSVYTVPAGKTLYVTSLNVGITKASTTGNNATLTLRATYDAKLGALTAGLHFSPHAEINHSDGSIYRPFELPIYFPARTDIKISVTAGQSATIITALMRGWIETA